MRGLSKKIIKKDISEFGSIVDRFYSVKKLVGYSLYIEHLILKCLQDK